MFSTNLVSIMGACKAGFFGLPHWYEYLHLNGKCEVTAFQVPDDLVLVALAVVDILIHIAGIVAVLFVIYGGIQYVTSQGNPDATAKAQDTIINALLGLALAVTAVAFVGFMGSRLGT